jgi:urea carboxylase-associated protein 1
MANKVVQDVVVAPNENWSAVLSPGQILRIVDLEGKQAVDFLCYNADDPADRYNAADTMKYNKNAYLGAGHGIYSVRATKLFTIVADSMGGGHDTIGGCCSAASNMFRYKVPDTPSCYANFLRALARHGMGEKDIVANINFFMNVPVRPDGATEIIEGLSKPGDFVDLKAEKDVLAVISNCPQLYNPCSGWNPTPVRLIEWRPKDKG